MEPRRVLVVTDNHLVYSKFRPIVDIGIYAPHLLDFRCSPGSAAGPNPLNLDEICFKDEWAAIVESFDLVLSLHCKQIVPSQMLAKVRCINVHPGFNPYSRGWFPHVFSMLDGKPCGATIHEIDERIDSGPIIEQREVIVYAWDTSLTVYERVVDMEIELLQAGLRDIIEGDYTTFSPSGTGSLNTREDFARVCELDLDDVDSLGAHINRLRALSHGDIENAWFIDQDGRKIYLSLCLRPEE